MGHGTAPKCGGTNRQGDPCGNTAGKNTDHFGSGNCASHGGATLTGRKAAGTERIERLLHRLDAKPCDDPLAALRLLAGRALAVEETIGQMVNELTSIRYESVAGGEQLRSEVAVLERAMDRAGKLLVDIAKLNIDERLVRVTEKQAAMAEQALMATLSEMGMDAGQQTEACARLGRHLQLVA